jgi:hypothetical protein
VAIRRTRARADAAAVRVDDVDEVRGERLTTAAHVEGPLVQVVVE